MARALPGRKGRAWGNALGGWRRQRRDAFGRFTSGGAGMPTKPPSARAMKKYQKKQAKADRKAARKYLRDLQGSASPTLLNNPKLRKDRSTSLRYKGNRSQEAFRTGRMSRQAGFVPYTRIGFANKSVGFNAGARVLPNYRLSGGVYLKVTNIDKTRREKAFRQADDHKMTKMAEAMSPNPLLDEVMKSKLIKYRRKAIDQALGGEKALTSKSYARLTTDQNAMPNLVVEFNRKDPRTKRKKRQQKARRKAQWQYNDMVIRTRGTHVTQPRAQRRGKGN